MMFVFFKEWIGEYLVIHHFDDKGKDFSTAGVLYLLDLKLFLHSELVKASKSDWQIFHKCQMISET